MSYILGVSSGIFGAAQQEEKMQYAGLPKKAQYAITKGVEFVQIDLESISEFEEFEIEEKMKKVEQLNISFGLHSETQAFGSREFPHLDSAIDQDYRRGHERLIIILKGAAKIKSKYVLVHSSESVPFLFLGRELQPTELVDPWGRRLDLFIGQHKKIFIENEEKPSLERDWIWKQEEVWLDLLHDKPEGYLRRLSDDRKISVRELARRSVLTDKIRNKKREKAVAAGIILPEQRNLSLPADLDEKVEKIPIVEQEISFTDEDEARIKFEADVQWKKEENIFNEIQLKQLWDYFKRLIRSRTLSYGPERTAYYLVAKWMEVNNDPLWLSIINITIDYYAKKDNKTREKWLSDKNIKKISIDDEAFRKFYQLWVPSVSAKYIWGHFRRDAAPSDAPKYDDPKKILEEKKIFFVFETPMAGLGNEDLLRLPQPAQMYYFVKQLNSDRFGIAVDIEHMLMDGLNVEAAIYVIPEGAGKWIRVVHAGWPSPLGPAHIPIPLGSEQQYYLYKTYWNLRQKGMGKDPKDEVFIIFERGGGGDPIQQSVLSLRLIKQFLEKDVAPEKLPMEFWGLETGQWSSIDRQLATVREHAWDPLKGLLQLPEEEHGVYSKAAVEKGKAEEWKKEKLR